MLGSRPLNCKNLLTLLVIAFALVGNAYGQTVKQTAAPASKTVQKSAKLGTVPHVIGKTRAAAQAALEKSGFKVGVISFTPSNKDLPDTVARQQPAANTPAVKGSQVNLWLFKQAIAPAKSPSAVKMPSIKPTLYSQQKALYLEFPQPVHNVVVYDKLGRALQRFDRGKRFDITDSLNKTKAGSIIVGFDPDTGGVPKTSYHRNPDDHPERMELPLFRYQNLASARFIIDDHTTIERHEPENNAIGGAPLLSAGYYSGSVGGDDTTDYLKTTSLAGGVGTLIEVEVKSGSVELNYYDPTRHHLNGYTNKFWIALAPSTTFYFQVTPTGMTATDYRISISKKLLTDVYEPNDTFDQAKVFGTGKAFLGNVIDSSGNHVGASDFYRFNVPEPQNLRIQVSNAGLASDRAVQISLYDKNGGHDYSLTGNANGCTLNRDLRAAWPRPHEHPVFPAGVWRVSVQDSVGPGDPPAYGNGAPPDSYTNPAGYSLSITVLP